VSVSAVDSSPVDGSAARDAPVASPAVEISGLVKRYAAVTAVDGLTLRASRGEVTALLGPNGAGKTTTIEICEGYRRPDSGTVRVLGHDPVRDARTLRPRVGVMPQSGGMPPAARPGEYLRLMASFHAKPADPDALLDRLGLAGSARTPLRRLSGGQQQRLSLAAAIVGRPELLFLDEPTAGLDPQARRATWDLIAELRSVGVSIVLTTHLMDEAERLADSVAIIDHGRLVTAGTPASLTGGRQQLRLRARPGLDLSGLLAALPRGAVATESPAGNYVIEAGEQLVGAPELLGAVATWCGAHRVEAGDLRIASRTLEDVFLELTGRELRS
jgi:ABC-2 type transport system ATP-binding protein